MGVPDFAGGVVTGQVEISNLDLRYEGYRLKSAQAERQLLNSIIEHGIKDPLQGIDVQCPGVDRKIFF